MDSSLLATPSPLLEKSPLTVNLDAQIHDYLVNNPEVLDEIAAVRWAKTQVRNDAQVAEHWTEIAADPSDPTDPSPDGDISREITLIEFFDYQCP